MLIHALHRPITSRTWPHRPALAGMAVLFTRKSHAAVVRACNAMNRKE
jgi:hypothetical protein